jgi:ATP phosphoribosyltransferase
MKLTPKPHTRLRIAIQKSGRLNNDSMDLLTRCGLKMRVQPQALLCHVENLPIDILFVRDDDILTLVSDNVCDLGIVGENVLHEKALQMQEEQPQDQDPFLLVKQLGFSRCRLSIAFPEGKTFEGPASLENMRIATSYPYLLKQYLAQHQVNAQSVTISGSVEIAPRLGMADAICDLVSTGRTLEENNLKEVSPVIQSQAVLIKSNLDFTAEKQEVFDLLLRRINGVQKAQESKYIMFHAPKSALPAIKEILPGCETPTIMALEGIEDKVAVHLVSTEGVFWTTLEELKKVGAYSILVLPIEKMLN